MVSFAFLFESRSPERLMPLSLIDVISAEDVPWYQTLLVANPFSVSKALASCKWVGGLIMGILVSKFGQWAVTIGYGRILPDFAKFEYSCVL
jgi:hypothetical protein